MNETNLTNKKMGKLLILILKLTKTIESRVKKAGPAHWTWKRTEALEIDKQKQAATLFLTRLENHFNWEKIAFSTNSARAIRHTKAKLLKRNKRNKKLIFNQMTHSQVLYKINIRRVMNLNVGNKATFCLFVWKNKAT